VGLAIVRDIVAAHGGEILVASQPGQAAPSPCFCRRRCEHDADSGGGGRAGHRAWLRRRSPDGGLPSGNRGRWRDRFAPRQKGSFDLILLDIMLPAKTASKCAASCAARLADADLVLTAKTQEAEKVMALELGADDYVTSPSARASSVHASRPCCAAPGRKRRTGLLRVWRRRSGFPARRAAAQRPGDRADAARIQACWRVHSRARRVLSRERLLEGAWGRTRSPPTASWTTISPTCARRSSPTPPTRATCGTCAAWDTALMVEILPKRDHSRRCFHLAA